MGYPYESAQCNGFRLDFQPFISFSRATTTGNSNADEGSAVGAKDPAVGAKDLLLGLP
jgi:hypothetical protein